MKRLFTYILAVVLPLYLLVAWVWGGRVADRCEFTGLRVVVLDSARSQFVSATEVTARIKKNVNLTPGLPISEIDTEAIEALLRENRLIAEVCCYSTPSGLLRVDISQRMPVMRVLGDSASFFIDEKGEIMPLGTPQAVSVPVATGHIRAGYAREVLYPFACFLRKKENAFWRAQIEQIYVDERGEVELVPRVGNHRILLGELTAYEEKLNNLRCLYDQAFSKCGWNKYSTINLKYKDQVVCTRKK